MHEKTQKGNPDRADLREQVQKAGGWLSSYSSSQRTTMQKPTPVRMAEGETGLGRRQLVKVVQPYHIRHLELGLSQVREKARAGEDKTKDTYFPGGKGSSSRDTEKDKFHFIHFPPSPTSLSPLHLFQWKKTVLKNITSFQKRIVFLPRGHGPFPDRLGPHCTAWRRRWEPRKRCTPQGCSHHHLHIRKVKVGKWCIYN